MAALITANDGTGDTTSPVLVLGFEAERESRNQIFPVLGGGLVVSLGEANPAKGTLDLFYTTEADAEASVEMHGRATTFTLTEPERPAVEGTYVLDGSVSIRLEDDRKNWVVSVSYQRVEA